MSMSGAAYAVPVGSGAAGGVTVPVMVAFNSEEELPPPPPHATNDSAEKTSTQLPFDIIASLPFDPSHLVILLEIVTRAPFT